MTGDKMTKTGKKKIDMINGPLVSGIIRFALPVMATGILQLLYNAADIVVVGNYAGDTAQAAVSSTSSLVNLIINVCIGLSVGSNVVVARMIGAKNKNGVHRAVHTAVALSLICGFLAGFIGFFFSRPLLVLMGSPADVIDMSALYLKIFFLGTPANLLYNFGSAILRASGDTKRPLIFLSISGVVNVVLNLFFVIVCGMTVDGVAVATIASQFLSAAMVVVVLVREKSDIKLEISKIRIYKKELLNIIKVGIPSGFQSVLFSISNVVLQSSYNSFGSTAMAGCGASGNIEGFVYTSMNSIYQATLTFVSQNYGAKNYKRLNQILWKCTCIVTVVGVVFGYATIIFGEQLADIYTDDPQVISIAIERLWVVCGTYFLCGIMEIGSGMLRGIDRSFFPMCVCVVGVCGIRLLWIGTVFVQFRSLVMLYVSYPISWTLTAATLFVGYAYFYKKLVKSEKSQPDTDLAAE